MQNKQTKEVFTEILGNGRRTLQRRKLKQLQLLFLNCRKSFVWEPHVPEPLLISMRQTLNSVISKKED